MDLDSTSSLRMSCWDRQGVPAGADTFKALGSALGAALVMETLEIDFYSANAQREAWEPLFQGMGSLSALSKLVFSVKGSNFEDCAPLVVAMTKMKNLRTLELDVTGTEVSDTGIILLALVLRSLPVVEFTLKASRCKVGDQALAQLLQAAEDAHELRKVDLHLDGTQITDDSRSGLLRCAERMQLTCVVHDTKVKVAEGMIRSGTQSK
mmetsp:Transcript_7708/g.16597  ORF Transcript_7708/g.16597 Transcript_7708/m.16597 type:complete len:209 (-) Transcript_7708:112-738(-)